MLKLEFRIEQSRYPQLTLTQQSPEFIKNDLTLLLHKECSELAACEQPVVCKKIKGGLEYIPVVKSFYLKATWILRPTALANFSSVESRMSVAWFSMRDITDLVVLSRFAI